MSRVEILVNWKNKKNYARVEITEEVFKRIETLNKLITEENLFRIEFEVPSKWYDGEGNLLKTGVERILLFGDFDMYLGAESSTYIESEAIGIDTLSEVMGIDDVLDLRS